VNGRRRASIEELEQPGDYTPLFAEDRTISSLWFFLPIDDGVSQFRIPGIGHGRRREDGSREPEWEISIESDGSVTVDPSINSEGAVSWHGWLRRGVWSLA
jgi:hypothetical protein